MAEMHTAMDASLLRNYTLEDNLFHIQRRQQEATPLKETIIMDP